MGSVDQTPPAMADATTKLSELLSAVRGRRAHQDAMGFLRRKSSSKTILPTTHASSHPSLLASRTATSLLHAAGGTSDPSSISSETDGGESPEDLGASMRLVRSYAARVKQMPPHPGPTAFSAFPPSQPPQRCFRFKEAVEDSIRRRRFSSPQVSSDSSPEPASSGGAATSSLVATRLIGEDGPAAHESRLAPRLSSLPFRRASTDSTGCISTGLQLKYPDGGSQRRLLALLPQGEDAVKTVNTRNVAAPIPRHPTLPRGRRSSMPNI